MSEKKEFTFEGVVDLTDAIRHVESLLTGLRAGTVGLQHGSQTLNLRPEETVKLEIEGKSKEDKEGLSIKLKWKHLPPPVEADPLVISDAAVQEPVEAEADESETEVEGVGA